MKLFFPLLTYCIFVVSVIAETAPSENVFDHAVELVKLEQYELALEALEPLLDQKIPAILNFARICQKLEKAVTGKHDFLCPDHICKIVIVVFLSINPNPGDILFLPYDITTARTLDND